MAEVILFQGDSITDAGRTYDSGESLGIGYANMVQGQLGMEYPGQYIFYDRESMMYGTNSAEDTTGWMPKNMKRFTTCSSVRGKRHCQALRL